MRSPSGNAPAAHNPASHRQLHTVSLLCLTLFDATDELCSASAPGALRSLASWRPVLSTITSCSSERILCSSHMGTCCVQNDDLVLLTCVDFGHLITKKKPEEDDKIGDLVNPHSVRGCCVLAAPPRGCTAGTVAQPSKHGNTDWFAHVLVEDVCHIASLRHLREQHRACQRMPVSF